MFYNTGPRHYTTTLRITITFTTPNNTLCWMPFMLSVDRLNAVVPMVVAPFRFICSFVGNFSNYFPIAFLINIGGLKKKKKILKQKTQKL